MQLRYYQEEAVLAALQSVRLGHRPVLQLATGTGKSLITAALAETYSLDFLRVWVLTHSQQLVTQNSDAFHRRTGHAPGIICSGLNRDERDRQVTFATIQSITNPALRDELLPPDVIIVDEAHRIPHRTGEHGQYQRVLSHYPAAHRIGMSATPWRLDDGLIYGYDPEKFWFNRLAYTYTVPQAVADGYLSPLVGVETEVQLDLEGVSVNSDYVLGELEERESHEWLARVAASLQHLTARRNHVAVYCPTIETARRAATAFSRATGHEALLLTGAMSSENRAEVLDRFHSGRAKFLCSVDTMTTGWDFPALDCIVCLRPTVSSSLWVQIQGRGTRLSPGKKNCLLLDYVGNLQRLGGVGMVETYVRESEPTEPVEAVRTVTRPERRRLPGLRSLVPLDPVTGQQAADGAELDVEVHSVGCAPIITRRGSPVLLITYTCTTAEGAHIDASMFVNTDRPGRSEVKFFELRSLAVRLPAEPRSVTWQVRNADTPARARVRKSGRYWNVINEYFSKEQANGS